MEQNVGRWMITKSQITIDTYIILTITVALVISFSALGIAVFPLLKERYILKDTKQEQFLVYDMISTTYGSSLRLKFDFAGSKLDFA